MKCSLGISDFLEEISNLSRSVVFLYFFALITEEGLLISPCYSLELCIQMCISYFNFMATVTICWAPKNWRFWTVVLLKTLQSPLGWKEFQPVHPKGNHIEYSLEKFTENQSWIFIGRTDAEGETPKLWPPDGKNWLIWKDPDAEKDWWWEEKGTTKDEIVRWHPRFNIHEFE